MAFVPRERCPGADQPSPDAVARMTGLAADAARLLAADSTAEALYAVGLIELSSHARSSAALDRAVSLLEKARERDGRDADLLNDLGAAYSAVGERDQALVPMLRALDAVDAALRLDSANAAALFNRARLLERLYLVASAEQAWRKYFAVEPTSEWSVEGRASQRQLARYRDSLAAPLVPQRARERFFERLGGWAAATQHGDERIAEKWLVELKFAADSISGTNGDASVVDTWRWLARDVRDTRSAKHAAAGLADFGEGLALHNKSAFEACERSLARAETELQRAAGSIYRWTRLYRAACETNQSKFAAADARLASVFRETPLSEPALRGKTLWIRGVIRQRSGDHDSATTFYSAARSEFTRAREVQNRAALSYLLSENFAFAGQHAESAVEGFRGLRDMASDRASNYLHNHLVHVASIARLNGLRLSALDLLGEALTVDAAMGRASPLAYARWTRAQDFAAAGDSVAALRELDLAQQAAATLTGFAHRRVSTDIGLVRGQLSRRRAPAAALKLLDSVVTGYRQLAADNYLPSALYEAASAARDAGRPEAADAYLVEALDAIDRRRGGFASAEARSGFYTTVENIFDALIGMRLDAGKTDAAFDLLERERRAVWAASDTTLGVSESALRSIQRSLRSGRIVLAYAVLDDRVTTWRVSRDTVIARTERISRDSLGSLVRRTQMENTRVAAVQPARMALHSLLLGSVSSEEKAAGEIVVIPDRELAGVSFAALAGADGRYLIEDAGVRIAPSAAFYLAAQRVSGTGRRPTAFIVANPLLDSAEARTLPPLRGALVEADRIAPLYGKSTVLAGRKATREAVIAAMPGHAVVHFAGHAVFDADAPERSYLALAGGGDGGRLQAREIATLRLSDTRLVVLSACRTVGDRTTRTGAVAGLAYSFLRAGVPAMVSTLWDVSDDAVVDVVTAFHERLSRGMAAPDALRSAQLDALRSAHPDVRAPAAWAAFQYIGP